jgi:hypothetical protein
MTEPQAGAVNIFLKVDHREVNDYFNEHDPSPLYNRQLSTKLEQYLINASVGIKRYSAVFYKMICQSELDKQYSNVLLYALRKHYNAKLSTREKEFERFKKRTWILLVISIAIVVLCQGFVMLLFNESHRLQFGVSNIIDVFSWVVLWQPIDQLLFHWNPHLKEISLLRKMAGAEVIYVNTENNQPKYDGGAVDAVGSVKFTKKAFNEN